MKFVTIGHWSFILGLVLAVVAGLFGALPWLVTALFVLGLVVGFLNVGEQESTSFLVAVIALLLVSVAGMQIIFMEALVGILNNLIAFMSAAALVVALKQVLTLGRRR